MPVAILVETADVGVHHVRMEAIAGVDAVRSTKIHISPAIAVRIAGTEVRLPCRHARTYVTLEIRTV